jgi:hypothetical protein
MSSCLVSAGVERSPMVIAASECMMSASVKTGFGSGSRETSLINSFLKIFCFSGSSKKGTLGE